MKRWSLLGLVVACASLADLSFAASLQGLGFLPGQQANKAGGISADGSTIVGWSGNVTVELANGATAFRWTAASGMEPLGHLPDGFDSYAQAVSADGTLAVGYDSGSRDGEAVMWLSSGGAMGLGFLPNQRQTSYAYDISNDGQTVVGESGGRRLSGNAYRWTQQEGMQSLGRLPGDEHSSTATGVNADGTAVTGVSRHSTPSSSLFTEPFLWTEADGMRGLGHLADHRFGEATAISADGSTVIGFNTVDQSSVTQLGFVWTADNGLRSLGTMPGFNRVEPAAVSADGSVVVGGLRLRDSDGDTNALAPFVWTEAQGLMNLADLLEADGVDISEFSTHDTQRLGTAVGVSDDGRTIAGWAFQHERCRFCSEAWIAEISLDLPMAGDTNADRRVDMMDLNNVRNGFAGVGPDDGTLMGDAFPHDGRVNIDDLNAVRNHFGAGVAVVPEPATLALALLSAACVFLRRAAGRGR